MRAAAIARLHLAPSTSRRRDTAQTIALVLYALNVTWLSDAVRRGQQPPLRLLLASPPWTIAPMIYEPFHGELPRARERDYYDGPFALHAGHATCIEVAAYDAAAMSVLEHRPALPRVIGEHPDYHTIVELADGTWIDTTAAHAQQKDG